MTAPGYIRPEPPTSAAAARPRAASGRVLAAIRCEVKFGSGRGYRKYLTTWAEVAGFLASPSFLDAKGAVKTVTIVAEDPNFGPDIDRRAEEADSTRSRW
jgi:hypothetical protein